VTLGLVICATGCLPKTVVVDSQSDVVRIGPNVKGSVYIYRDGQWVRTSKVHLPEGWYAGPGPK
jgi:hypothetical protein